MTKQTWIKSDFGLLPHNNDARAAFERMKSGAVVTSDIKQMRNGAFHRKLWALFKLAYDNFDNVNKMPFDDFRKNLIILAGYRREIYDIEGNLRLEAKSISYAKMSQDEFERLYSDVIDVILQKIMPASSYGEIDNAVREVIAFC